MADRQDSEVTAGRDIINQMAVIIRSAQVHDPGNVAVLSAIDRFIATVNSLLSQSGAVALELLGEYFYINAYRVKISLEYLFNFDFLTQEFKRRGLGSLVITAPITTEDVQVFLKAFLSSAFSEEPFNALSADVSGIISFGVGPLKAIKESEELDAKKLVKKTYFNAVSCTKGIITKLTSGEKINVKAAKRIVESMVDMLIQEKELLFGMTAIKAYDDYTYHHCINVSILSIALGQKLGLNRKMLTELGLAALFHDIGKIKIPPEILNKQTEFDETEWQIIKRHPMWGVRAILNLKGIDETSNRTAIVAFEHHLNYNLAGYPKLSIPLEQDLFSKVVTLADQYDAMTASRVYSRTPIPPDKSLSIMVERAAVQLDPLLLKFFINMVGVFPAGTLVLLDTKELGLVVGGNVTFQDRPKVKVIVDSSGNKCDGYTVDLTEKNDSGGYMRTIIKTLDPNKYKINLGEYLL